MVGISFLTDFAFAMRKLQDEAPVGLGEVWTNYKPTPSTLDPSRETATVASDKEKIN